VYAIFGLSILLSYPNGGGDSSMICMLHVWALLFTIIIDGERLMTCMLVSPATFPLSGEES